MISISLRSLKSVLEDLPSFAAKFLKTDAEGFDFEIIQRSLEFIWQARPIIYFECDQHIEPSGPKAGPETNDCHRPEQIKTSARN